MAIINGTPGIDNLVGTLGNDQIFDGGGGSDVITALTGNDEVTVTGGIDTADLGLGTGDRLIIDWSDATGSILDVELLVGTVLLGYAGAFADGLTREVTFLGVEHFTIRSGSGNDRIITGDGNDVLEMGAGDDFGNVGTGTDSADGGNGTDGISYNQSGTSTAITHDLAANSYTGPGSYSNFEYFGAIQTGSGDDTIVTTSIDLDETISTNGGNDSVTVAGGSDTVDGGSGSDELIVDYSASTTAVTGGGSSGAGSIADGEGRSVDYSGFERFVIRTGSGDDNVVITGAASVTYDLGGGNNSVVGGSGDDVFDASEGNDTIDGGGGSDTVSYENNAGSGQTVDLDAGTSTGGGGNDSLTNVENVEGSDFDDSIAGDENANRLNGNGGNDILSGRDGNDTLDGGDGDDDLDGGAGADTLNGGAGNDSLDGGSGADSMAGGDGDDVYTVDDAGDSVSEIANAGRDRVETSLVSYTLGANVEDLRYTGSGDFTGTGNGLDNVIAGGTGNDTLDGGAGSDTVSYAGNPADGQSVDLAAATSSGGGGTDSLAGFENVVGSDFDDTLSGDAGANGLSGSGGNDTLSGRDGDDSLDGGSGNDRLDGGAGADAMAGGDGDDIYVVDAADTVTENPNAGRDRVETALAAYALGANLEDLTFAGSGAFAGTGNELDNAITGGAGSDTLSGQDGNDTLTGGDGNDFVYGGAGTDTLFGNNFNDYLDGGSGADAMDGGLGDDTYIVDDAGDTTVDAGGRDTVRTTLASYTLSAGIEILSGIGTGPLVGTGNALDNIISGTSAAAGDTLSGLDGNDFIYGRAGTDTIDGGNGNDYLYGQEDNDILIGGNGNDYLEGGVGIDTMIGGAGNDIYLASDFGDIITELANEGIDAVRAVNANYTLGVNLENLAYSGTGNFTGYGNVLNNVVTGGNGNDFLYGMAGDDTLNGSLGNDYLDGGTGNDLMQGGVGNDAYIVDSLADRVGESPNEGIDTVQTSLSAYLINQNIENLNYLGSGNFTGTGNNLANSIIAQGGNDVLSGMDGDDIIYGRGGNDTLLGGAGYDKLFGGTGADVLTGGAGGARFSFQGVSDSVTGAVDRITDFNGAQGDRIDLVLIDAVAGGSDNNFAWIGTAAFGNVAGQLRYEVVGGNRIVSGDVDGDGVADFVLQVDGAGVLTASDFLL